jgi:hypothetical protein
VPPLATRLSGISPGHWPFPRQQVASADPTLEGVTLVQSPHPEAYGRPPGPLGGNPSGLTAGVVCGSTSSGCGHASMRSEAVIGMVKEALTPIPKRVCSHVQTNQAERAEQRAERHTREHQCHADLPNGMQPHSGEAGPTWLTTGYDVPQETKRPRERAARPDCHGASLGSSEQWQLRPSYHHP